MMTTSKRSRFFATCLTIVFGSIPATFIAVLPAMAVGMSVAGLFSRQQASELPLMLLFLLWGLAGIYGTVALWLTPFLQRSTFVRIGLVSGLLAILPATVGTLVYANWSDISAPSLNWQAMAGMGYVTVPVVALSWLYYFAKTKKEGSPLSLLWRS